eukprot:3330782-Amphidinium_carterae.1
MHRQTCCQTIPKVDCARESRFNDFAYPGSKMLPPLCGSEEPVDDSVDAALTTKQGLPDFCISPFPRLHRVTT